MRRVALLLLGVIACVAAAPAWAHGDLERADPAAGDHVGKPPKVIELDFAEPPTADSRFVVRDGCGADVLAQVTGEGRNARLEIEGGDPGLWRVSYRTVSSVDGHLVRGKYRFHVANKKKCDDPAPSPEETEVGQAAPPTGPTGDGGSGPLIPILVVGGVVVGAALAIRVAITR